MRTRFPALMFFLGMTFVLGCDDTPTAPTAGSFVLILSPTTVTAGAASHGTVTMRSRSSHPFEIHLSSSDAVASVPSSIVIPSGSTSAAFDVTTRLVAADTMATISATAGNARQEVALQVVGPVARPATLDGLEVDATTVRGGQSAQGTVRLTGVAPAGGLSISIRSSNAAALVPATVTVPPGALTAAFTISTRPVTLETQLEITAFYSDQTRTVPLQLMP
jgi:hypothetical protein